MRLPRGHTLKVQAIFSPIFPILKAKYFPRNWQTLPGSLYRHYFLPLRLKSLARNLLFVLRAFSYLLPLVLQSRLQEICLKLSRRQALDFKTALKIPSKWGAKFCTFAWVSSEFTINCCNQRKWYNRETGPFFIALIPTFGT